MNINKEDVTTTKNYKDNMRVMQPQFQKLFNNHQPKDFRIIELIKQQQKIWHIDDTIPWGKFNLSINGLKSTKVVVLNVVPSEVFKYME